MLLKRQYDPAELAAYLEAKTRGELTEMPMITHVEVMHTGTSPEQNFDDGMIDRAVIDGWATLSADRLQLKTDGEPLRYTVTRAPGYFCKSTGEAIPMSAKAWARFRYSGDSALSQPEARAWLKANDKADNDYDIAVAYHCVLDADQHERFRAVKDAKNRTVAAHTLEA